MILILTKINDFTVGTFLNECTIFSIIKLFISTFSHRQNTFNDEFVVDVEEHGDSSGGSVKHT